MNATKNIAICLGIALASLMPVTACAGIAGYTQFVNGSVRIVSAAGEARTLQKGVAVNEGDTVISAKGASAQIRMQDGGFVAMRPDTQLKFDSFKFSGKEDGSERSYFSLFKGGFRAVTGLIGRVNKPNYRITTSVATIGIRGTDHETYVVTPDSSLANGVQPGTYNKVNVGETFIATDKGTIFVLPNQMGYAGAADQMPELRPLDTDIFTVADKPAREAKSDKEDGKEVRETATVDNTAEQGAAPAVEVASAAREEIKTDILQRPITTTDGKDLTGGGTTHNPAYNALNGYGYEALGVDAAGGWVNPYAIELPGSSYLLDGGNNLVGVVGGSIVENTKFDGGVAKDTYVSADGSVYFGRWQGGTYVDPETMTTVDMLNTITMKPTSMQWVLAANPPSGFVQTLVGTKTYDLTAATHPTDHLGNIGTLTTATLTADFINQIVNASLALSFSTADPVNISTDDKAYTVTTPGGIAISGDTVWGTGAVTCSGSCQDAIYSADIWARFAGNAADKVAIPYNIIGGSELVQGVALVSAATPPAVGTFAAYTPSNILIETAVPFFSMGWGNPMAAPADITYNPTGSSNLSSFIDREIVGDASISYSVTGGATPVTGAATTAATGIRFGRWSSVDAVEFTLAAPLGGANWGVPTTWMYGPEGYWDDLNTTVPTGTFIYALDGSTAPYDSQSGQSGTLTGASISVDFISSLVSADVALTVGGQAWSASATGMSLNGSQFFADAGGGGLIVSMGAGTPTTCQTCFGSLSGAFTGQNYAGAILSYNLGDSSANAGGEVSGQAALVRTGPTITDGTATPTGMYVVADFGGSIQTADTLSTDVSGVLTAYSQSGAAATGYMSTTVTCTTCTVAAPTANTPATGIHLGTWDTGSFTQTWGFGIGSASPHWITGPEAGPLFLANALVGTKTFSFDGGMVTNFIGTPGTVLGTTALTVDFTRQVVGINLDLSVPDMQTTPVSHTWNAKTLPGDEAIINGGRGIGGAAFRASSYNGTGPGLLTVTVDAGTAGETPGFGNVSGQLTGIGLNGAILSYDLNALLPSFAFEQVNGVAALASTTSNVATPHRQVLMSLTEPNVAVIPAVPVLGYYANAPARTVTDVTGNLTQFDMNTINNGGDNNPSMTLTRDTSLLADAGNDAASGISWGRWEGGSVNATDRNNAVTTPHTLAGSLHWIAGPTETAAVTLPVSGTYTYTNAGGTLPTDNLGNTGTLNNATLSANFTAQTVDVGVNVTVAGSTLDAAAANVPIIQRTAFYADSQMPGAAHLTVTCTTGCGTSAQGVIVGGFTGAGATGAMMAYGLQNVGAASTQVISGVTAFHR